MHQFHKFIFSWNSTCFGQFVCPSSGVYSLYTKQWYMSYRFVDSCRAGAYAPAQQLSTNLFDIIPLLSVQWINSWWWTEALSETCRVSCQNKFAKLVHLVGFIIKKRTTRCSQTPDNPKRRSPYMSYRFVDNCRAGAYAPARQLPTNPYDIYDCWVYSE